MPEADDKGADMLLLALEQGSAAESWLLSFPEHQRSSSTQSIAILQARFATPLRLEMVSARRDRQRSDLLPRLDHVTDVQ